MANSARENRAQTIDPQKPGKTTLMPTQNAHILLVECDATLREITAFRLELLGYQVTCKDSADSASKWLKEQLPDMIAVGFVEDMEPTELLNSLSNDPRTSPLPMIYVSAGSELEEVQKAYNAGADEYLVTPYDPLVLEQKIESLLRAVAHE